MTEKEKLYRCRVYDFLDRLEPGTTCEVAKMCVAENRELFVQAVKDYMGAFPWDGWLNFNKDYTRFYKIHPIQFKIENSK